MENTGLFIYTNLIEIDAVTGLPTGITKPNVPSDPDYIAPFVSLDCPLSTTTTTTTPVPTTTTTTTTTPVPTTTTTTTTPVPTTTTTTTTTTLPPIQWITPSNFNEIGRAHV